jgi:hypothetical protein
MTAAPNRKDKKREAMKGRNNLPLHHQLVCPPLQLL